MEKLVLGIVFVILGQMYVSALPAAADQRDSNTDSGSENSSLKIQDLRAKLTKLKTLLDELDSQPSEPKKAEKQPKAESKQAESHEANSGDETLSEQDILLLKSLQVALNNLKEKEHEKPDKQQDVGHFGEAPVGDPQTDKRTLHDKFYIQDPSTSFWLPQDGIPAKKNRIQSGSKHSGFGNFTENVLEKIVYRLLADLDLALKNDISVEEIIQFLYNLEQASRSKQKKSRVDEEQKQLRALLQSNPGPRD